MFVKTLIFFVLCTKICDFESVENSTINDDFVPRVVNGWPAKKGDVPYQISFKTMISRAIKLYTTFCGGVLIAENKLLSAAHCFEQKGSKCLGIGKVKRRKLSKIFAVAGNLYNRVTYNAVDSEEGGQWRQLRSMVYPRTYKFPKDDISVGFTIIPFMINNNVATIPYANRYADYSGQCLVSGFGRISKHSRAEVLMLAHLELMPRYKCNRKHRKNMAKFVCTNIYLSDVGKGDSGGPLVCANTKDPKESKLGILVGIVSGTRPRVGTFFTRVSSFSRYIERGTGILSRPNVALVLLSLIYDIGLLFLYYFISLSVHCHKYLLHRPFSIF